MEELELIINAKAVNPKISFDWYQNHIRWEFIYFNLFLPTHFGYRYMLHTYNLGVHDLLAALTKEAFANEAIATDAKFSDEDLRDSVHALRGLIVAVCAHSIMCIQEYY